MMRSSGNPVTCRRAIGTGSRVRVRKPSGRGLWMRRCGTLPSRAIMPRGWRILPRSWALPRDRFFSISRAKTACFLRSTRKRCGRFRRTWTLPRMFGSRDFLRCCAIGWGARSTWCTTTGSPIGFICLGNYGTDLALRREINRFLVAEDPYGMAAFVRFGLERGELRKDLDLDMIVSILEWTMDRFQDALLTEELDPGTVSEAGRGRREERSAHQAVPGFDARARSGLRN